MSGRRGDSDFTLQEGGNGTLPPHAHVCIGWFSGFFCVQKFGLEFFPKKLEYNFKHLKKLEYFLHILKIGALFY